MLTTNRIVVLNEVMVDQNQASKRYFNLMGMATKLDFKFMLAFYDFIGIMFSPDSISGKTFHKTEPV